MLKTLFRDEHCVRVSAGAHALITNFIFLARARFCTTPTLTVELRAKYSESTSNVADKKYPFQVAVFHLVTRPVTLFIRLESAVTQVC